MASFFSASIQVGATKTLTLLQPFARSIPEFQIAEAHVSWCIQRDQRKIAGAKGRFFFSRVRGGGGDKNNQQEISWQSSLNFDMSVLFPEGIFPICFLRYLRIMKESCQELIGFGVPCETSVTVLILVYHAGFSSQNILGIL